MKLNSRLRFTRFILNLGLLFTVINPVFAQFVESSDIVDPSNKPAIDNGMHIEVIFDVLIIVSALMFIISMFGFAIGFLKMVTSGGDEKTAEAGSNMLVLSGWIFGASALSYLLVNVIKYFIY